MKTQQNAEITLTIDGESATAADLGNIWGKVGDPIHALQDAPGRDVGESQPFIWGLLVASNWTIRRTESRWHSTTLEFESGDNLLTCHIITSIKDKDGSGEESLTVEINGECNGEQLPEVIAKRFF